MHTNVDHVNVPQPNLDGVGQLARRAAPWALAMLLARHAVTLGTTMVVSRLVSPADFGLVGMISTFVAFVVLFDTGITWATVPTRDLTRTQVDSLFWVGVLLGTVLWGVCIAAGPALASFYGEQELSLISTVIGASVFFNSLTTQPAALLKRAMRQKTSAIIDTVALTLSCALGMMAAARQLGFWAIVAQLVSVQAFRVVLLWLYSGYRPSGPQFSPRTWEILRTGGLLAISNCVNFVQLYIGSVAIGRLFGAESLGLYVKATALKAMPTMIAAMVFTDIMVASLAVLRDDPQRMGAAYRKALVLVAFVGCPAGALLYPLAPELVRLIYGDQWGGSVPLLELLALSAVVLPITTTTIWLFLAAGKSREQLAMNLVLSAMVLIIYGVATVLIDTVEGFVALEVVVLAVIIPGVSIFVSHRAVGLSIRGTAKAVIPVLLISAVCAGFIFWLGIELADSFSWQVVIIAKLVVGATLYMGLAFAFVRPVPLLLIRIARGRMP